jgi:hypothetical protein
MNGTVKLVLSGDLDFGDGNTITATNLEIYTTNASFNIKNNTSLSATSLRFYATGTGVPKVQAGGTLKSGDAFFYLTSGDLEWNGQAKIELTAPTSGAFKGLVMYLPWSTNSNEIKFNGGSTVKFTGTLLMPHCQLQLNGDAGVTGINSQIVAWGLRYDGGADVTVNYNPNLNFGATPPQQPTIELVK